MVVYVVLKCFIICLYEFLGFCVVGEWDRRFWDIDRSMFAGGIVLIGKFFRLYYVFGGFGY